MELLGLHPISLAAGKRCCINSRGSFNSNFTATWKTIISILAKYNEVDTIRHFLSAEAFAARCKIYHMPCLQIIFFFLVAFSKCSSVQTVFVISLHLKCADCLFLQELISPLRACSSYLIKKQQKKKKKKNHKITDRNI